jgi:hypothetical protein
VVRDARLQGNPAAKRPVFLSSAYAAQCTEQNEKPRTAISAAGLL